MMGLDARPLCCHLCPAPRVRVPDLGTVCCLLLPVAMPGTHGASGDGPGDPSAAGWALGVTEYL